MPYSTTVSRTNSNVCANLSSFCCSSGFWGTAATSLSSSTPVSAIPAEKISSNNGQKVSFWLKEAAQGRKYCGLKRRWLAILRGTTSNRNACTHCKTHFLLNTFPLKHSHTSTICSGFTVMCRRISKHFFEVHIDTWTTDHSRRPRIFYENISYSITHLPQYRCQKDPQICVFQDVTITLSQ